MSIKVNYLNCKKGGHHEGQQLNVVCLAQSCRNTLLCCCACIQELHYGHPTKTLKKLVSKAEEVLSKGRAAEGQVHRDFDRTKLLKTNDQEELKTLNKWKHLRLSINATLDQIQQNLATYYKQMKSTLQKPIHSEDPIKTVENILSELQSSTDYRKSATAIQSLLLQLNKVGEDGRIRSIDNSQQSINNIIRTFNEEVSSEIDGNIAGLRDALSRSSNFLFDSVRNVCTLWQRQIFRFSPTMCNETITVQDENNVLAQGDYQYQMALMEPQIILGGSPQVFRFKISKVTGNWIAVGMAYKKIVQSKKYLLEYSDIGHGAYMISANGGSWSHETANLNGKVKAFKFAEGDIIVCTVDTHENVIYFTKQARGLDFSSMERQIYELSFTPIENDTLHPCVTIHYLQNSVEYLPATNLSQIPKYDYLFSEKTKHPQIKIQNGKIVSILSGGDNYRVCLMNKSLEDGDFSKPKQFSVKILASYCDWIGVGICHGKTAAEKGYKFYDFENQGHGYYMISSNGGSWSSTDPKANNIINNWAFKGGDVIDCYVQFGQAPQSDNGRIIFSNGKKKYILPFTRIKDNKLYPCIMLHYVGDQVSIMPTF